MAIYNKANGKKIKKVYVIDSKGKRAIKKVWNATGQLIFRDRPPIKVNVSVRAEIPAFEREWYHYASFSTDITTNETIAIRFYVNFGSEGTADEGTLSKSTKSKTLEVYNSGLKGKSCYVSATLSTGEKGSASLTFDSSYSWTF